MRFWKKYVVMVIAAVMILVIQALAELEIKPYGAVQYRLRENITTRTDTAGNSATVMDYSHRYCWRLGLRAKIDDKLSLQFQIGNDWGASDNVTWAANNGLRARVGHQNLYLHLASVKWNPGYMFVEAGVVPLISNGTLELLEASLNSGNEGKHSGYGQSAFNGWGDMNNSLIGLRLGVPILKEDVKISAELLQSVIDAREQPFPSPLDGDAISNPPSILMVFTVPIEAGAFRITPELTTVLNRNFNVGTGKGDHEILFGAAASYKINDGVSVNLNVGYGMVNNEKSRVGAYGSSVRTDTLDADNLAPIYKSNGLLVGVGGSIKVGPGIIQTAANYNTAVNTVAQESTNFDYFYTDLRYTIKVHKNFTVTPRYRTYFTMYPDTNVRDNDFRHRFELIIEGLF